jgi:predicted transcriptional regulator
LEVQWVKLSKIQQILEAEILVEADNMDKEIKVAYSADLISDVLAMCSEQALLITGMTHIQVIKAARICDLAAVAFVRGKRPSPEVIELAKHWEIPVLLSRLTMYEASGLLFSAGLSGYRKINDPQL